MEYRIEIDSKALNEGLPQCALMRSDGSRACLLEIQYPVLSVLDNTNPIAFDFLLIASGIYCVDKLEHRRAADDTWTRQLVLRVPVSDVRKWSAVAAELSQTISFLTGDEWSITFAAQKRFFMPSGKSRALFAKVQPKAVSLFSGGLDSWIGVIDWLEQNPKGGLYLVGHHERHMPGPKGDQDSLNESLRRAYPHRTTSFLVRVGHLNEDRRAEITLRGRSLIFIALGIFAADSAGPNVPLLIPENGTIALNVPLTPSRRGSCSTRTAHPHYLELLSGVLSDVGLVNPLLNPLRDKTKGEAVQQCLNQVLLEETARQSVSCAKRGHRRHWTRRDARSCGRCMPCIYRRAAMHAVGWDDEIYGDDICVGEVDVDAKGEKATDFRACLSFLNRNPSQSEVANALMSSGSIDSRRLRRNAEMVNRTMDEIRAMIRASGTSEIKRLAGVKGR